jgi:ABC-2 type transport system permease protein
MTANTLTSERALRRVTGRGWHLGFGNMLANELGRWFGARRWLAQLSVFVVLINGMVLMFAISSVGHGGAAAELFAEAGDVFSTMLMVVTAIGVVVLAQGAIIGEKQLGTAAWVMSKPASRAGFVLAKFFGYGLTLLALAILPPSAIYYAESLGFWGLTPGLVPMVAAMGLVVLHFAFYLALMLALGTVFTSRAPAAAIGIGLLLAGVILGRSIPLLPYVLPWPLPALATGVLIGAAVPADWFIPVIATAVWTVIFLVVALWRFSREEF